MPSTLRTIEDGAYSPYFRFAYVKGSISMGKRTGRPAGRPKLYEKRVCIGFTAAHLSSIQERMDRDGLTFNDAVRVFLDAAITQREHAA